ncbi:MAG: HDOD domain-containing protein [Betaproteobacteria bacterium]|nr:HDOD domain-containing protein [Betaproteobacteria bacterium]
MTENHLRLVKNESPAARGAEPVRQYESGPARFLIRQPVIGANQRLAGYELKLRDSVPVPVVAGAANLQQMRDEMLLTCTLNSDLRQVAGDNLLLFLSLGAETLYSPFMEFLPKANVVVATARLNLAGNEMKMRLGELGRIGVRLALDDPDTDLALKLPPTLCRYARIDSRKHDLPSLARYVDTLRTMYPLAKLMATHVDTDEMRECCGRLGIDYFQGQYFTELRPNTESKLDGNRWRIMELLNLVISHAEVGEIEEKFKTDAALSYRLLRYINSPALMLQHPIQSISQAVMFLGHDQLYRWLALLLFSGDTPDPRSLSLLRNALVRARFTENLGQCHIAPPRRGGLFIVGLLSMLDALLNLPMAEAIAGLKLPEEIVFALLKRAGPLAPYLELAIACEHFDRDAINRCSEQNGFTPDEVNFAHVDALIWAERLVQQ